MHENGNGTENPTGDQTDPARLRRTPWLTLASVAACVGVFMGLTSERDLTSWETLARWGYLPANEVWNYRYWALFSSVFVHLALWHVAFNVYWLWVLGSRLEREVGSLYWLLFFLASSFVTSALQLAGSDTTGHGASGVGFAMFGFMWTTRRIYPSFRQVLDGRTVRVFVLWLIGCVVVSALKIWEVGNIAHITGLLFGAAAGALFLSRPLARLGLAGLGILGAASVAILFWCPWSVVWLSTKALHAHSAGRYEQALGYYSDILRLDPGNAWAYFNRGLVFEATGKPAEAQSDREKARKLDPKIAGPN